VRDFGGTGQTIGAAEWPAEAFSRSTSVFMRFRWSIGSFLLGAASAGAITSLLFLASERRARETAGGGPGALVSGLTIISALDSIAPPAEGATLIVPVQGVRPEQLEDTYTQARSAGRSHDAIDIVAPRGTPVLSVAPAVVLKRFDSVRGGTALYTLAADGRTIYYYAHLDRYAEGIVEGLQLQAGDVIGYVGDTGNAGPGNYHLHFGISTTEDPKKYWGGKPLNPYPLLTGNGEGARSGRKPR
jgi:murein DD-endopeptidase MepM/ murein hydrolase activator NlpD